MRRVVVTGMGIVSPLGVGLDHNWSSLMDGKNGFKNIEGFKIDDIPCQIAGLVPRGDGTNGTLDPDMWVEPKEQRKIDPFILYGLIAAQMAVADSGWVAETEDQKCRTGVMIGSGIGGLQTIYETSQLLDERGPRRVSPFFIPSALINLVSGQVSIKFGFKGPNHAVVTACSTGAHAIGDASRIIKYGDADVMIAGGAEAAICRIGMAGFAAARALSTGYNDAPEKGSRPWDKGRDGFVMGEGSGLAHEFDDVSCIEGVLCVHLYRIDAVVPTRVRHGFGGVACTAVCGPNQQWLRFVHGPNIWDSFQKTKKHKLVLYLSRDSTVPV